jgi:hypothetical protein
MDVNRVGLDLGQRALTQGEMRNIRGVLVNLVSAYNLPVPTQAIHASPGDLPAIAHNPRHRKRAKVKSYCG